jgi:hypothetical protein
MTLLLSPSTPHSAIRSWRRDSSIVSSLSPSTEEEKEEEEEEEEEGGERKRRVKEEKASSVFGDFFIPWKNSLRIESQSAFHTLSYSLILSRPLFLFLSLSLSLSHAGIPSRTCSL